MLDQRLSDSLVSRLPDYVDKDVCATYYGNVLFLTHIFENGFLFGFWSHSPWGTTRDQEQGWAVLDREGNIIDGCETRTMGPSAGNDFNLWRKCMIEQYGKRTRLCDENGEMIWKITEV